MPEITQRSDYIGDINIEHGGAWFNLSNWKDGYVTAMVVTDLHSAIGFTGAVMIERYSIGIEMRDRRDKERIGSALAMVDGLCGAGGDARKRSIAWACLLHGGNDPEAWDGRDYSSPHVYTVQLDDDGPMEFDSWKADQRMTTEEFEALIDSELWAEG